MRRAFREVDRRYRQAIQTPMAFRITAGDEFQSVLADVERSFEILTYLRALVATGQLSPPARFRASIGIGAMSVASRQNPYEEDGTAFVRSRRGLEELARPRGPERWTKLITEAEEPDLAADAVLCLADRMLQGWTVPQWEAIRWGLLGLKREEIAKRLGIAHQNVTKRLLAAGWHHFQAASEFLKRLLGRAAAP